jgi:N-acetylglucosaminyldiphosphoundecaprenol N-acetyl-beta-D-mannosaminyltransferase
MYTQYPPAKQSVLGVRISTTNYREVATLCKSWISERRRRQSVSGSGRARYICVTSVHGVITAFSDPVFREILNAADVATPDGMPVVWALRSFGERHQSRVYGPDLMMALCGQAAEAGHSIFLYGAREETLKNLRLNLTKRFPGLRIVGSIAPPFRPLTLEEDERNVRHILDSGAEIVFVGLSTPKQEAWMFTHREQLPGVIMLGVGAAFDFHAGNVPQAPHWMQRAGLEWLFRLLKEPKRLWKRYLLVTPIFLPLWALQKLRLLRY